jgi:anionic cell wall polymer biosynthesis LytR-Cps2A-Psr (LCP) family protein
MDGFVTRRPGPGRKVGGVIGGQSAELKPARRQLAAVPVASESQIQLGQISRSEIDASLRGIDDEENQAPPRQRKVATPKIPSSSRRKWIKRIILAIIVIGIGFAGYLGIKAMIASGNVFQGSILDVFQNAPLKQDANGRSNILILGTSEDDPGHQGANLTDSMMIMSIDQNNKNAYMISIPRDLYVKYGEACDSGYAGKINVYYSCVHDGTGVDADRAALTKSGDFIGKIFGLDIQYGANVNYTVMRDLVNAVGGTITVDIEGNGGVPAGVKPGSVMDSNFDWKCGVGDRKVSRAEVLRRCPPNGHFIDYGPGPQTLDAEHALYLAQARGDSAPTWGLAQSNFDREKNQQKIIKALKDKATSAGVLSDFGKVSGILDSLGNNLRTTFETKEVRTLASLAKDIPTDQIQSISLIDGDKAVMGTGMVDGQSVVKPSAGTYDYSDLRAYIQKELSADPVTREAAPVAVYNGSGVAGVAQTVADKLTAANYNVQTIATAPDGTYPHYTLYHIGTGNDATASKLEQRFGVKAKTGTPPVTVAGDIKFVLIVGPDPSDSSSKSAN